MRIPLMMTALCVLATAVAAQHELPDGSVPGGSGGDPGRIDVERMLDFGVALQLRKPYFPPGGRAVATLFFFNLSDQDADGAWADYGGLGCRYDIIVRDAGGRIVWQPRVPCPREDIGGDGAPVGPLPFPAGSFFQYPVEMRMKYLASETPDPDGEPLPGGPYTMEARHDYAGPVPPEGGVFGVGGEPRARVPFRVVLCDGSTGPMAMRTLLGPGAPVDQSRRLGAPTDVVLRTKAAARAYWEEMGSGGKPPYVDFRDEMVIASVPYGSGAGGGVEILGVEEFACHIVVQIFQGWPEPGQAGGGMHAVAVPRSLKEVMFLHAVVNGPESGSTGGGS